MVSDEIAALRESEIVRLDNGPGVEGVISKRSNSENGITLRTVIRPNERVDIIDRVTKKGADREIIRVINGRKIIDWQDYYLRVLNINLETLILASPIRYLSLAGITTVFEKGVCPLAIETVISGYDTRVIC